MNRRLCYQPVVEDKTSTAPAIREVAEAVAEKEA
jgi:hypothetical protein